jgi:hypothetical protein
MYGVTQKPKAFKDNIYRDFSISGNDMKIIWTADTKEILNESDFRKLLNTIDMITTSESIQTKKVIDNLTKEKWL